VKPLAALLLITVLFAAVAHVTGELGSLGAVSLGGGWR
jgi:hypothetical protein